MANAIELARGCSSDQCSHDLRGAWMVDGNSNPQKSNASLHYLHYIYILYVGFYRSILFWWCYTWLWLMLMSIILTNHLFSGSKHGRMVALNRVALKLFQDGNFMTIMWVKQCHKPPPHFWWFIPPMHSVLGGSPIFRHTHVVMFLLSMEKWLLFSWGQAVRVNFRVQPGLEL